MQINTIEILGREGCRTCSTMYQTVIDIMAEKNIPADIRHTTDLEKIMSLGVMSLPGVVINGKVVSYGKKLSKEELERLIDGVIEE
ncbi:thioredoxin family protein [Treponema sp.]|uniref:thioredoxin family protein n=1 Tax=Treponema sp. TaxID=166 RepID=UPI003F0778B8